MEIPKIKNWTEKFSGEKIFNLINRTKNLVQKNLDEIALTGISVFVAAGIFLFLSKAVSTKAGIGIATADFLLNISVLFFLNNLAEKKFQK